MRNERNFWAGIFKFYTFIIILSFIISSTFIIVSADSDDIEWSCTIKLKSSDESGNQLVFGESKKASDGKDVYDIPAPPFPPTLPNINTRFLTDLSDIYGELIEEYKEFPDEEKLWNFSVVWLPEPNINGGENSQTATISITWNQSELKNSEYSSIVLWKNNENISNMLADTSYIFTSSGNEPHSFMIVCQKNNYEEKDNEEKNTPFPSISAGLIIIMIITFVISNRRKANL